jgi:molybdenum cofactor cytidylyltransferase
MRFDRARNGEDDPRRFFMKQGVVPAIVLAAGESRRMGGRPKATLPIGRGETFLTHVVRTFLDAGVDDVVVVLGHEAEAVAESFVASGLPARLVVNRDYPAGQRSSVLAGLATVDRPGTAAVLLTLVDVPLVTAATVRAVVERYRQTDALVVRPASGLRHGHPVLIDRRLFDELRASDERAGIKPVVRRHATRDSDVAVHDRGAFVDIDTPEDYTRVML